MGKRAQNKLNNPAALCVFMLGDSGWEAQRPFQTPGKTEWKECLACWEIQALVCQRQQEADMRGDWPCRMSLKSTTRKRCHPSWTCALHLVIASLTGWLSKYPNMSPGSLWTLFSDKWPLINTIFNQSTGSLFHFCGGSCLCSGPAGLQTSDQYSVQSSESLWFHDGSRLFTA